MKLLSIFLAAAGILPARQAIGSMAFPGTEWEMVSPQSQDVDRERLEAAVRFLEENTPRDGVKRLVIVRHGRMIWKGPEAERRHRVWSVSKALTSTAHGLLIDDGKCTLDTLAKDYNPQLAEYYPAVTLRHLATMTSGIDGVGGSYDKDADGRGDRNALVAPAPPFFPPGTKYQYWDEATQHYGFVLTKIAGEALPDLLQRRILGPIGIREVRWQQDDTKKNIPNWTGGLEISASDLARFGHLFLNRGRWDGKQLISAKWVDEATRVQVPPSIPDALPSSDRQGSGIYGYHWWPNGPRPDGTRPWPDAPHGTYARSGHNNNHLFVFPAWDMVIVRLGLDGEQRNGGFPIPRTTYDEFFYRVGAALSDPIVEGARRVWQPVTITFRGPRAGESDDAPNPFLDYRLQVTFSGPSGEIGNVPGFFDGDGRGGDSGDIWRVRFTPEAAGRWSFKASFRQGNDVAVSLERDAGKPAAFDGHGGEFAVAPADPNAPGFLQSGRLEYAGGHYLKFRDGPHWVKGGTDEPEDLLAYSGFDNTRSGTKFAITDYGGHVRDWQPGDPDWGGGKGKGFIGALNYLAAHKVNLIYFMPMNIGGDGQNVWPFAGRIDPKGSRDNDTTHYDIGKLRQWEIAFEHAQRKGIVLHFVFNEAERPNKETLGGKALSRERKLYYREIIARFGHHNALLWNLCEEFNLNLDLGAEAVMEFARYIRAVDPYRHPLTVHHARAPLPAWEPFIGSDLFDLTSLQIGRGDIEPVVESFRELTRKAGRPLPVAIDEFTVTTDKRAHLPTDDFVTLRKEKIWPAYLSGGQVEVITEDLLDTHDFRKHERLWDELWFARKFLEENFPFWEMEPADELLTGETAREGKTCTHDGQVFAKPGICYALYLPLATATGSLDLTNASGSFIQRWYNPRTGAFVGGTVSVTGGKVVALGPPPEDPAEDWAVLIQRAK